MENYLKYDFYIQLFFLTAGIITECIGYSIEGKTSGVFYFIVGVPQLISFFIRAFRETKKSIAYYVYGLFIIPVWFSLLLAFAIKGDFIVSEILVFIIFSSLLYSPILAFVYVYDSYRLYRKMKIQSDLQSS